MSMRVLFTSMVGLASLALASQSQAVSVTVNLGASAETFVQHGQGPTSTGRSTYSFDQGSCGYDGTHTTCTLSGSFTGLTPGFTSGTYAFVTEYAGTGPSPILGISSTANQNFFVYQALPASASMTLDLFTSSGSFAAPLVVGGLFVKGTSFSFSHVGYTCSGVAVPVCTQYEVGQVAGAIGAGRVSNVVQFAFTPLAVPEPETYALMLAGLGLLGWIARRRGAA